MNVVIKKKKINIALQSVGTHAAFSWGVIDKLLEDGRFEIEGCSSVSAAGIMCTAMAHGFQKNGTQGARDILLEFWKMINKEGTRKGLYPSAFDKLYSVHGIKTSPFALMMNAIHTAHLSPQQWNPSGYQLYKQLLQDFFDTDEVSTHSGIKLFLSAINVRTCKLRIFSNKDLNYEKLIALSCAPTYIDAVEVDGEHYWGGDYIGNPALYPLIYECESPDIVVILIHPREVTTTPKSFEDIVQRMQGLFITNTLIREMRSVQYITSLIEQGIADKNRLKHVNVHVIEDNDFFVGLDATSKFNTDWDFILTLFEKGQEAAQKWIDSSYDKVGHDSSADIKKMFM